MINLDQTFCESPNCQNKCGRKLIIPMELVKMMDKKSPQWKQAIWYANFCDENGEVIENV